MRALSRWLVERGGLVVIVALLLYAWAAPPHLSSGDNAEFATLGSLGGAAHPTGYPLYVVWLRLWSWLPAETPAHATALATCILGGASLLVLHAACRAWGASSTAASLTIAVAAGIPVAVRLHSEAEVFALNGLVAGAILWIAGEGGPLRGGRRAFALGLVAGLGIANHLTCVFLAPIGIFGVVRGARESKHAWRSVGLAVVGLVLGLLPYVYIVLVPETRGSWGKVEGLTGLVHHVLRMDYGGPGELSPRDDGGTPGANIIALLRSHGRGWLWGPCVLGFVALAVGCLRRSAESCASRVGWWMLAASWGLTGIGLVSRFNLPPSGPSAFVTQRFHLLPMLVFAIPVAVGLDLVARRLRLAQNLRLLGSGWASAGGAALLAIALIAAALPRVAAARSVAIELSLKNMLRTLPPDAVVIGTTDEFHFGMGYLQGVLGERPDVTIVSWGQVPLDYMRRRITQQLGYAPVLQPRGATEKASVIFARRVLDDGRPLFIDEFQPNIATSLPVYPYGLVFRVLPAGATLPTLDELFTINDELYQRYTLGYATPSTEDIVPAQIHETYARPWRVIADGLRRIGNTEKQEQALLRVLSLAPES